MTNPLLAVPDEELMATVRANLDPRADREMGELERRFICLLLKLRATEAGVSVAAFLDRAWEDAA